MRFPTRTSRVSAWAAALTLIPLAAVAQAEPVRTEPVDCRWNADGESYCEEREYELPARSHVEVDAGQNGGIQVVGWDRDEIRLVAMVRAWSRGDDPRDLARQIEVRTDGVIEPDGPRSRFRDGWSVSFELMVPRDTELRLRAHNGGIGLENLAGTVDARTTNGGIHVLGGEGRIRAETTNGGLDVELTGRTWNGAGLDLETTNGGVRVAIPDGYSAELETGTVNGGMEMDFPITVQGRISRILRTQLGDGGPLIRARTTNGGVQLVRR